MAGSHLLVPGKAIAALALPRQRSDWRDDSFARRQNMDSTSPAQLAGLMVAMSVDDTQSPPGGRAMQCGRITTRGHVMPCSRITTSRHAMPCSRITTSRHAMPCSRITTSRHAMPCSRITTRGHAKQWGRTGSRCPVPWVCTATPSLPSFACTCGIDQRLNAPFMMRMDENIPMTPISSPHSRNSDCTVDFDVNTKKGIQIVTVHATDTDEAKTPNFGSRCLQH